VWRHRRHDLRLPPLGSGSGKHVIPTMESRISPATGTSRRSEALPRLSPGAGPLWNHLPASIGFSSPWQTPSARPRGWPPKAWPSLLLPREREGADRGRVHGSTEPVAIGQQDRRQATKPKSSSNPVRRVIQAWGSAASRPKAHVSSQRRECETWLFCLAEPSSKAKRWSRISPFVGGELSPGPRRTLAFADRSALRLQGGPRRFSLQKAREVPRGLRANGIL
jgi:hypothetical protein